ncbi:MAG: hypothetical protein EAZ30_11525 [Betaproteobacteria bacterium]|nr:MAG: hypothetical protein EAZ30_11525 [Betaproteobacteria bacterium]
MRNSLTSTAQQFRWSRIHGALHLGQVLCATTSQRDAPVRVFFKKQDDLSGSCGILAVGTALSILGVVKASAFENAPRRKHGSVSEIWSTLGDTYFSGIAVTDLYERLGSLELPIKLACALGKPAEVNAAVIHWLSAGGISIIAYENTRNHYKHYVLGIGLGGVQHGKVQTVDSILTIDSGAPEPMLSAYNGVMQRGAALPYQCDAKHRLKAHQWQYQTAHCDGVETVQLIGAIHIRIQQKA